MTHGRQAPARARQRAWADTLALRLFGLIWAALVVSHGVAYLVVQAVALPPLPRVSVPAELPGGQGGPARPDHPAGPDHLGGPGGPGGRTGPPGQPPMPTFPSLPPTPGLSALSDGGPPPGPGGLPLSALLLDYGVRVLIIGLAAWWGSRWLAQPVGRLVHAAEELGPALAAGQHPKPLDEHLGTREVQATATVFNRMARQIQQLFRGRGLMMAAISHDLRTPLTRMRLRVETAAMDGTLRQRCVADLNEMNALIDTALHVFRGSEGTPVMRQRIDITSLVQALVDDRAELGAAVSMQGQAQPVWADAAGLKRVLGNVLDNAQHYAGAAAVTVGQEPGSVWVAVEDRGPGIPAEQLELVLQPFVRVESSRNPALGGTGLGLFIALELTRQMGGQLTITNRDGGGLAVCVRLPADIGDTRVASSTDTSLPHPLPT